MDANEIIFEVAEASGNGFEARARGYSIFTQAETLEELKANIRDAIACHFEDEITHRPKLVRLHNQHNEPIGLIILDR
jgi:hypothetical protein